MFPGLARGSAGNGGDSDGGGYGPWSRGFPRQLNPLRRVHGSSPTPGTNTRPLKCTADLPLSNRKTGINALFSRFRQARNEAWSFSSGSFGAAAVNVDRRLDKARRSAHYQGEPYNWHG